MSSVYFALTVAIISSIAFLVFFVNKKFSEIQKPSDGMNMLMQTLAELRPNVNRGFYAVRDFFALPLRHGRDHGVEETTGRGRGVDRLV